MAAGGIIHEDWLNDNRNRKYPFLDSTLLLDNSSSMTFPNDLIVDMVFPVNAMQYDVTLFHLQQVTVFAGGVIITLGFNGTAIATRAVTEAEHSENKSYYIEGSATALSGGFSDSVGRITIGRFDSIKEFGGTYTFSTSAARLLPTVLRPSLKGVTGVKTVSADNEESALLQGDIELLAGDNIEFKVLGNTVIISALPNPDFAQDCSCPDVILGQCIKTINGVAPDSNGNFTVVGENCLVIDNQTLANGIKLNDTCATPCCGCQELSVLQAELSKLGGQVGTQEAFAQRAMANIEQLRDVVLSSKLGTIVPC